MRSRIREAATLIIFLNYFYASAASERLGALGALYGKRQVLIPPRALVRCVVEHCARVPWVLQERKEPVEDRLARTYLEMLFSAVEQKKTTGRMLGKDSEAYLAAGKALQGLQAHAALVFGEPIKDAHGRDTLPKPPDARIEDCVAWMMRLLRTKRGTAEDRAI